MPYVSQPRAAMNCNPSLLCSSKKIIRSRCSTLTIEGRQHRRLWVHRAYANKCDLWRKVKYFSTKRSVPVNDLLYPSLNWTKPAAQRQSTTQCRNINQSLDTHETMGVNHKNRARSHRASKQRENAILF